MSIEDLVIGTIVLAAAVYLIGMKLRCFGSKTPPCSSCNCDKRLESDAKK